MKGELKYIEPKTAKEFLLPKHYSGRIPQISVAFGLYSSNELKAVCTFGKPASNSLCIGVCGQEFSSKVYELNRLCRLDDWQEPLSQFVSACLRRLSSENWIIVSYADTEMNHNGYIYQACNFIYTGLTKKRTDKFVENNKHSRHYSNDNQGDYRKVRSEKHRYIYFSVRNNSIRKIYLQNLKYPILPYPKGDNKNYILGEFLKPNLVQISNKVNNE